MTGLAGLPPSVGLGLAILGYLSFVLLIRWALLSWRRDWDDLWRADTIVATMTATGINPGDAVAQDDVTLTQ